jgi:hypothetical protein
MITQRQRFNRLLRDVTFRMEAVTVAAITLEFRLNALNAELAKPRLVPAPKRAPKRSARKGKS